MSAQKLHVHGLLVDQSRRVVTFAVLTFALAQMAPVQAADWFVTTNGSGDGSSWASPTNSIQGAINAATAGVTVWVSNGVYEVGGITNYPQGSLLTNRVAIYKAITVRSANNDPTNTVIKGAWDPLTTNGPAAMRCVYMTNGSALIGFMLTNGATWAAGAANVTYGGGVWSQSTNTVISNCVLTGNSALYGGGTYYGALYNCVLAGNSAVFAGGGTYYGALYDCTLSGSNYTTSTAAEYGGGGAAYGNLYNCTIVSNYSARYGGGAFISTLTRCTLSYNSANRGGGTYYGALTNCALTSNSALFGGGTYYGTLTNCVLTGNSAPSGGGAYGSTLFNCTLAGNSASAGGGGGVLAGFLYNCTLSGNSVPAGEGGGARNSTLYNCALTGNSAGTLGGGTYGGIQYNCTLAGNSASSGGGAYAGTLINCVVYFNSAAINGSNWYVVVAFTNTCTAPAVTNGVGNITADPRFVNTNAANYRLSRDSPAINAGTNFSWMTSSDARSKDLDGHQRIDRFSGRVDMGAYEYLPSGTVFIFP